MKFKEVVVPQSFKTVRMAARLPQAERGRGCGGKFPISEYKNLWVRVFLSHLVETLFVGLIYARVEAWSEREAIDCYVKRCNLVANTRIHVHAKG